MNLLVGGLVFEIHLGKYIYSLSFLLCARKQLFVFFLRFYLFFNKGEGREKERERTINVWLPLVHLQLGTWPTTQACALTGNQTGDLLVCRLVLNPLSHTSQGTTVLVELL